MTAADPTVPPGSTGPWTDRKRTIGCIGGIGINTAHELGHKKESHERWLSKIALARSWYGHFYIEHNRGHHVRVATPEDPASSRVGESFYRFWSTPTVTRPTAGCVPAAVTSTTRRRVTRAKDSRPGRRGRRSPATGAVLTAG